jgi:putative DNA primase/helicase
MSGEEWTEEKIRDECYLRAEQEREQFAAPAAEQLNSAPSGDQDHDAGPHVYMFESASILYYLAQNQIGDAELFKRIHRGKFLYDHAEALWYRWVGHYWQEDRTEEVVNGVQAVCEIYEGELQRQSKLANSAASKAEAARFASIEKALRKRKFELQAKSRIRDILTLARAGDSGLSTSGDLWDSQGMLLACKNGVINLQDGSFRPGRPDDLIKTACPLEWAGINAPAPAWDKFTFEIFDSVQELIDFMQRLIGYCITAETVEEKYPIFIGCGRNGKSKFIEAIKAAIGNHGGSLPIESILESKFDSGGGCPRADIMAMREKRLMTSSESDDGKRLKVGKLKHFTGGDSISARSPYGRRQVDFVPRHKLILLTNFEPVLPSDDFAIWERILKIPFNIRFVDEPAAPNERKKDEHIKEKLQVEYPGILAWCVRGCLEWQRIGLKPPESVAAATATYRAKNDSLSDFIRDCCVLSGQIQAKIIFDSYVEYCRESGLVYLSSNKFSGQMKNRFDAYASKHKVYYTGISLSE